MRIRPFQVAASSPVVFAPGASATVGGQGPLKKATRVVVITDAGVRKAGLLDKILPSLGERAVLVDDGVVPDADVAHIDGLAKKAADLKADAILAVGGGSVLDTAKCVAAVLAKGQGIAALEGIATVRAKLIPIVAVPTTSGTGSEATQFAVVKDRAAGKKVILMDLSLVPAQSVLDPELLVGLPASVTAATGVDAITHAVEALGSKMQNPIASALAVEAVRVLVVERALEKSLDKPDDLEARGNCLVAAHLAGQAISSAMLGACHAFAHALGALKGVPHGVANGVFLAPVMRLNQEKARAAYAHLGAALGATGETASLAQHAVDTIEDLVHGVARIPSRLSDLGVVESDLDALTKLTMADADLSTNPVALDEQGVRALLAARL
jgi:alcohol dehydrogenase class IV